MVVLSNQTTLFKRNELPFNFVFLAVDIIERIFDWSWLISLHKKCPYLKSFWSVFFRIGTKYEEILRISPYSVRMRENTDQNNSEYGCFLRNIYYSLFLSLEKQLQNQKKWKSKPSKKNRSRQRSKCNATKYRL